MTARAQAPQPCTMGSWLAPFDHGGTAPSTPSGCGAVTFPLANLNALHMSVIPRGAHQGHVIVWDHVHYAGSPAGKRRQHPYGIVDPINKQFWNHAICLPVSLGDFFCAGHAWTAEGKLLVVGGTGCHAGTTGCNGTLWEGSKLAYLWTPPTTLGNPGTWDKAPDMADKRWYPSVIAMDPSVSGVKSRMVVSGGVDAGVNGYVQNNYQVWQPTPVTVPGGSWVTSTSQAGPTTNGAAFFLDVYPRMHFLSTGEVMTAGMRTGSARIDLFAPTPTWVQDASWVQSLVRNYGSSVLYPIAPGGALKDYVLSIGGRISATNVSGITNLVETSYASQAGSGKYWFSNAQNPALPPNMIYRRHFLNTVLLSDTTILAIGGEQDCYDFSLTKNPALVPELFVPAANVWQPMAAGTIIRDYHSTAVLLPDGSVLTGGGDSRDFNKSVHCTSGGRQPINPPPVHDYQIFVPHYIQCQYYRPVVRSFAATGAALEWNHGAMYYIQHDPMPFGITISKVVLMRGGSVTHHSDGNQRCVELDFQIIADTEPPTPGYLPTLQVTIPTLASRLLPRGYYMLFLVTNAGGISVPGSTGTQQTAPWVKIRN